MTGKNYNIRRDPFSGRFTTEANARALQLQFREYAREVNKNLQENYAQIAAEFVKSIDRHRVPAYTGNMHDGIGVGLIVHGVVRKWNGNGGWKLRRSKDPNEIGTRIGTTEKITNRRITSIEWKKTKRGRWRKTRIGVKDIEQHWGIFNGMIDRGRGCARDFLPLINEKLKTRKLPVDVTIMLFAAMPYSEPLNLGHDKHGLNAHWFDSLVEDFASKLEPGIKRAFLMTKPTPTGFYSGSYRKKTEYSTYRYEINLRLRERLKWYSLSGGLTK